MRKLEIESWEDLMAQEFATFEVADEEIDEFWPVDQGYVVGHDGHRWELDPASAEDYGERTRAWMSGSALKWRHWGH